MPTDNEKDTRMNIGSLKLSLFRIATSALLALSLVLSAAGTALAAGVVGDGTPSSCTEAALTAALAPGGRVSFNCGGPTTILVAHELQVVRSVVIDGNSTITISGGQTTRLFNVPVANSLTLRNITLDNAFSSNGS